MTYRRIAALRTAADFRAYIAALGVTLPFDETLLQTAPLLSNAAFRYTKRNTPHNQQLGRDAMALNDWLQLEGDVCGYLKSLVRPGLSYSGPKQCIPGFPTNGFKSDGCLTDGKSLLALEIEAAQMHQDTNIGKYWLLQTVRPYERIALVHVFTPKFDSYAWRKQLGEFYVGQMPCSLPLDYIQLDRRKAMDYAAVLDEVKRIVDTQVARLFDSARPS